MAAAMEDPSISGRRFGRAAVARVALATVASLFVLVAGVPSAARATHDGSGYWFFQDYLQRPDGTRTVTHVAGGSQCCSWVVVRMSWEPWTHDMNFIFITWGGSWHGFNAQSGAHQNEWDITQVNHASDYRSGGCQNPSSFGWYRPIWTNCHVRRTL